MEECSLFIKQMSEDYLFRGGALDSGSGEEAEGGVDGDQDCLKELMDWDVWKAADPGRPLWFDEELERAE